VADVVNLPIIKSKISRTHARLTRLRLFNAFAVPAGIFLIALILVVSGIFETFSGSTQALLWFAFLGVFIASLVRGIMRYRGPSRAEAADRLDRNHPHRLISSLADRPASFGAETQKYWDQHRSQLMRSLRTLKSPTFSAEWRKTDPFYLRYALPILVVVFLAVNQTSALNRMQMAAGTDLGALFGADEMEVTAWLTPPDHTGEAPVFLTSDLTETDVPIGSILTVRVNGPGEPKVKREAIGDAKLKGSKTRSMEKMEDGAWQLELPIEASQRVAVTYWGERAAWSLSTEPDKAPTIQFDSEPSLGDEDMLVFDWSAEDDYGIETVSLVITPTPEEGQPQSESDEVRVEMTVAMAKSTSDDAALDLTRHKWAGLPVTLNLRAKDAAGQLGESETIEMVLPEKLFLQPLAKVSQEIRLEVLRESDRYEPAPDTTEGREQERQGLGDRLARAPEGFQRASLMLDSITYEPEFFFEDLTVYFGLRRAHEILRFAKAEPDVAPIDDLLWSVALRAEYGTVADAARRLAAARRALERALRDGASEEEIRRLMEAFRNAAEDFIAARMAEAIMNGGSTGEQGGEPPDDMLGGQDLADMLEALEDLTETGATDAARQLLSDVTNLLNNLQFQSGGESNDIFGEQNEGEESEDSDAPPEERRLERALDRLAEILEEQRRLNDETIQERFGSDDGSAQEGQGEQEGDQQGETGQSQPGGQQPGSQQPGGQQPGGQQNGQQGNQRGNQFGQGQFGGNRFGLAERQSDLLEQLEMYTEEGEQNGSIGSGEGEGNEDLDEARRALQRAEDALRRGDLGGAQFFQDRATQNMREAFGDLSENLDDMRQARRGEDGDAGQEDPLGRSGGGQDNNGDDVAVPDQVERQRARDILDQLRERLNDATTPEEREYLERLLDRF
tara:strand:- start:38043 stop:40757 length:2715 start_codon:yes stop_codon:yes gene_type:complete